MTRGGGGVLVLVGTKAQFIKTAPILREFDPKHAWPGLTTG